MNEMENHAKHCALYFTWIQVTFLQLYKVGIIDSFFTDEETEIQSNLSIVIQVIGELSVFRVCILYTFIAWVPHCCSRVQLFLTLWTVACQAPLSRLDSPVKNIGVGCHAFLQGILLTHKSLCLLRRQAGSSPLVPLGKPVLTLPYNLTVHGSIM